MTVQRNISDIRIGKRHRKRMGDIEGLARSIEAVGLLQPVAIDSKGRLIAGERRIRAFQHLGRSKIPVTVIDLDKIVHGEYAENTERENFTLSEAVSIKRAIEPLLKAEAKQRKVEGGKLKGKASAKLAGAKGDARDLAAKHTGKARTSLAKAEAIVAAAEAEPDNEKLAKLVEAMDGSGRVDAPYRRLKNMRQAEAIRSEPPPLPNNGPYRCAMIDFPWAYDDDDENAPERGVLPYSTLSIKAACAFARHHIAPRMHEDAVIGFWVTNYILARGLHLPVLKACGFFKPKSVVTWPKARHTFKAHWVKGQTEHFVIAARGKAVVTLSNQTTLLQGPFHLVSRGQHSAKPIEAYSFFESLYPAPRYADFFSRYQHNDRWDCFGDQAPPAMQEAAE